MEKFTLVRGRDTVTVRERGLEQLLSQGWELVGAEKPEDITIPQVTSVDSGPIKVRAPRKKQS